jgi:hypothetical protein
MRPFFIGSDTFVIPTGLEPVTARLEGGCSIH